MMTTPFLLRINYYINIINIIKLFFILIKDFPGSSVVKNPSANTGDIGDEGLIPRSGRSPGGGNGNPLHYSDLENTVDRGAWWATVHGVAKSLA